MHEKEACGWGRWASIRSGMKSEEEQWVSSEQNTMNEKKEKIH